MFYRLIQKVGTYSFLTCSTGLCFFRQCKKKKSIGLPKNSHTGGSGDAPAQRRPAASRGVRVAAEPGPFLSAILSRLSKKQRETTSAPLLHKAAKKKYGVTAFAGSQFSG